MTLDLASAEWSSLEDAFGPAIALPALLAALESQTDDVLDELYSRICHQGSIYSASIAAFPHLISSAGNAETIQNRTELLALAGQICESHDLESMLQHSSFAEEFSAALPAAYALACEGLRQTSDANDGIYLLKAAMSFAGYASLAKVLDGIVNEEFTLSCPGCGFDLYIWPVGQGLNVAAEDPVSQTGTKKTQVSKGRVSTDGGEELGRLLSSAPSLTAVGHQIPYIFGNATCPTCKAKFSLVDALLDEAA
jgi:hypothetical protein